MDKETNVGKKFLDTLVAHNMLFDVKLVKKGKEWEVNGAVKVSVSRDYEHFGEVEASVKSYDSDMDGALGTVMLSLGNYVSTEEFVTALENKVIEAETKQLEA